MNAEPTRQDVLAVDIQSIEKEWMRLWSESVSATPANGGHPATRNSVLNLIIFTRLPATTQAVERVLDDLCLHHPARVLLLAARPEPEQAEIKAWIDLSPYRPDQGQGQCSGERAIIEASGTAVGFLPGVVLPLLAPNLPVFLWWADVPPLDQPLFERLTEVSDRMIVDSAEVEAVGASFLTLARISRSRQYGCAVSDLNWQRTGPWRELIAQFFDAVALQPYLHAISHLVIEYVGTEADGRAAGVSNPAQALLLVGWLASSLNWSPVPGQQKHTGGRYRLALRTSQGDAMMVEIRPRAIETKKKPTLIKSRRQAEEGGREAGPAWLVSQMVAGALSSVTIVSVYEGHTGVFTVRRSADYDHASTSCSIDGVTWGQERTVHLASIGRSELLGAELDAFGHEQAFEDALSVAGALAE